MTTSVLILLATVLTLEDGLARIDKGYVDGVRTGDSGTIYYTLAVGPERSSKRIDVGQIEILEVGVSSADFQVPQTLRIHPGYSVEIRIPRSRFRPTTEILHLARRHLREGRYEQALSVLDTAEQIHQMVPGEPSASDQIAQLKAEIERSRAGLERTVRISAGSYEIGVDLSEARFHNQYPRFRADVETFRIDREPISLSDFREVHPEHDPTAADAERAEHGFVTGITFDAAAGTCRRLGMRLPTEFEWEIAARNPRFDSSSQVHEWTSSWYLPYPGNDFPDRDYGEAFKVLKGGAVLSQPEDFDSRLRRFLKPDASHPNVGFRCVRSPDVEAQP